MRALLISVRSLRRSPAFTAVAVVSLALALGLVTAVFSVIDAVRHPVSAFRDPERLFQIVGRGDGATGRVTGGDRLRALEAHLSSALSVAHAGYGSYGVASTGSRYFALDVTRVSANFFDVGGVRPFLGRFFTDATLDEDVGGAAIISHRIWRQVFGGERDLAQLRFTLDSRTYQVVGVAPPVLGNEYVASAWLPLPRNAIDAPSGRHVWSIVRLRDGVDLVALRRDLRAAADHLTSVHGTGRWEFRFGLHPIKADPMELSELHWVLIAAAAAVLLIACANLANLVLARGLARQRDVAVRLSLGARRRDVVREILLECGVLALCGAAFGVLAGSGALDVVSSRLPDRVPYLGALIPQWSWRVVALTTGAALASAAIFGILPALRLSDSRLALRLHDNAGTTTGRTHGRYSALVVGQVALALLLLTGASLFMRASQRIRDVDLGFDPRPLTRLTIGRDRQGDTTAATLRGFHETVRSRLGALPYVESVAWVAGVPTDGNVVTGEIAAGRTRAQRLGAYSVVSDTYFGTTRIPIVAGRALGASDRLGDGAAVVDEALARRLWKYDDPIGRMIKTGDVHSPQAWLRVVGVARTLRGSANELPEDAPGALYVASREEPGSRSYVVRSQPIRQTQLALAVERTMRDLLPPRQGFRVAAWTEGQQELLRTQTFLSRLFGGFAVVALVLCALGLYSVLAYAVSQRRREYGIRLAIGARRADVFRTVLRDGAVLVLAGTALGGFLTTWTNKLVDRYIPVDMYHVDPVALVVAEAALVVIALCASAAPAWRATRANPVDVLRAV
jgi:predicted permease